MKFIVKHRKQIDDETVINYKQCVDASEFNEEILAKFKKMLKQKEKINMYSFWFFTMFDRFGFVDKFHLTCDDFSNPVIENTHQLLDIISC